MTTQYLPIDRLASIGAMSGGKGEASSGGGSVSVRSAGAPSSKEPEAGGDREFIKLSPNPESVGTWAYSKRDDSSKSERRN